MRKICQFCREKKDAEEFTIIGGEEAHDKLPGKPITINETREICLSCRKKFVKPIPKVPPKEIASFAQEVFGGRHREWPLSRLMGSMFGEDSRCALSPLFSERLKSVLDLGFVKRAEVSRSVMIAIVTRILDYLLTEDYITSEGHEQEYRKCESLIEEVLR